MKSDTLVNTGTPTSLNSIYDSEVDNLCGTTVLGRYTSVLFPAVRIIIYIIIMVITTLKSRQGINIKRIAG